MLVGSTAGKQGYMAGTLGRIPEYYRQWPYPDFQFPADLPEWKDKRLSVRETLMLLLGEIPPRPQNLKIKTLLREERNGYIFEKFLIDNGVDSWIPGYLAIPAGAKGKVPVILGMHGHSSSKDNIFGFDSNTAQDVLALFISNGYAVMAIDSYFNGDRRGTRSIRRNRNTAKWIGPGIIPFQLNLLVWTFPLGNAAAG